MTDEELKSIGRFAEIARRTTRDPEDVLFLALDNVETAVLALGLQIVISQFNTDSQIYRDAIALMERTKMCAEVQKLPWEEA